MAPNERFSTTGWLFLLVFSLHRRVTPFTQAFLGLSRDLGEHLRRLVAKDFPKGESTSTTTPPTWLEPYTRLAQNHHSKRNPRLFPNATATGIKDREALTVMTSSKGFEEFNEMVDKETLWGKIRGMFGR